MRNLLLLFLALTLLPLAQAGIEPHSQKTKDKEAKGWDASRKGKFLPERDDGANAQAARAQAATRPTGPTRITSPSEIRGAASTTGAYVDTSPSRPVEAPLEFRAAPIYDSRFQARPGAANENNPLYNRNGVRPSAPAAAPAPNPRAGMVAANKPAAAAGAGAPPPPVIDTPPPPPCEPGDLGTGDVSHEAYSPAARPGSEQHGWARGAIVPLVASRGGYWGACALDASDQLTYAENAFTPTYPGDGVKLVALLLAHEALDAKTIDRKTPIRVSAFAAAIPTEDILLTEGQEIPAGDAMSILAARSAPNLAAALLEHFAGGDPDAAVMLVNETCKRVGMTATMFTSIDGKNEYHEAEEVFLSKTTLYDMCLLARALAKHTSAITDLARRTTYTTLGGARRAIRNTNWLLSKCDDPSINGMWVQPSTPHVGACALYTFQRDGGNAIIAVWGAASVKARDTTANKLTACVP